MQIDYSKGFAAFIVSVGEKCIYLPDTPKGHEELLSYIRSSAAKAERQGHKPPPPSVEELQRLQARFFAEGGMVTVKGRKARKIDIEV